MDLALRLGRALLRAIPGKRREACLARIQTQSLSRALQELGLSALCADLARIVPDLRHQYTDVVLDTDYRVFQTRALHAFQIALVKRAISLLDLQDEEQLTIVDIGDSAGTHIQYLQGLLRNVRSLSVNLDPLAVKKIQQKGLEAIHARAEDTARYMIHPDIFLCFETLEHLPDPIQFLRALSSVSTCKAFVITVPYVACSRVGLAYIRKGLRHKVKPESVHFYELAPEDWRLVMRFSGWRVLFDQVYRQFPRRGPYRLTKQWWGVHDFEGFYGVILARDGTWSELYDPGADEAEVGASHAASR